MSKEKRKKISWLGGHGSIPILQDLNKTYKINGYITKENDPFDFYKYYHYNIMGKYNIIFNMIKDNADLYHLHGLSKSIKHLKRIRRNKKYIIHYRGTDVRKNSFEFRKQNEKHTDAILVSTPDLLNYDYTIKPIYLPNPIDTELFHNTSYTDTKSNTALIHLKKDQTKEDTLEWLKSNGYGDLDITWITQSERNTTKKTEYCKVSELIKKYEYYIDIYIQSDNKSKQPNKAFSVLALQFIAMGKKVIGHDGKIHASLPEEHLPSNVIKKLDSIYRGLLF